jgi:hypothetical protein
MYPKAWKQWSSGGDQETHLAIAAKEEEVG